MQHIKPEHVDFVLVEPYHPGNIGAAARALKTMGFPHLVLVNPCDFRVPEARWMAHASAEVFDSIRVVPTLQAALDEVHFAVATTQRARYDQLPFYTPAELGPHVVQLSQEHRVAIVFGRERAGLSNDELRACHVLSTIPAAVSYPSLNLSQAVMLYAYELFKASYESEKRFRWHPASYQEQESVYRHLEASLRRTALTPRVGWARFIMQFKRVFARAYPERRDVRMMHKILQAFDDCLEGRVDRQ
jgi:TrmH family RNA methyltransferase